MKTFTYCLIILTALSCFGTTANAEEKTVDNLADLYQVAQQSGNTVRIKPGVYALDSYLNDERIEELKQQFPDGPPRQPRWLLRISGNDNTFDFTGVSIEINTELYAKLPYGYTRCIFIDGNNNTIQGLTLRNTGPSDRGSNGNILSVFGNGNTLKEVNLYVSGSKPYGYGDLLGKGGPNLTGLQKQSGIMVTGENNTLKRCKVFSRAFGHCFYIQNHGGHNAKNILLEDCYAEGTTRTTNQMLSETEGLAYDLSFRSVYQNRDGRFMITPGYTKSLSEDGFRTYGGVGNVTLRNCIANHTRAGFEIGGTDDADTRTILEGCQALGTERGYLLGSNVLVRDSRGDILHGPLLYLRGGVDADVELELIAGLPETTVHALATIAGKNHSVKLYTEDHHRPLPALPIMLGFGMPQHAEMSSPILPAETSGVTLINKIPRMPVIVSDDAENCDITSPGPVVKDAITQSIDKDARGKWPASGIAR